MEHSKYELVILYAKKIFLKKNLNGETVKDPLAINKHFAINYFSNLLERYIDQFYPNVKEECTSFRDKLNS